jgi:hypothetical protein
LVVSFRQIMSLLNILKTGVLKLVILLLFYVQLETRQARRIEYIFDAIEAASQSLAKKSQG